MGEVIVGLVIAIVLVVFIVLVTGVGYRKESDYGDFYGDDDDDDWKCW